MRTITCRTCHRTLDDAHVLWAQGSGSGRCPFCRHFYDPELEAQAGMVALDPAVRRRSANKRIGSAIMGAFFLACAAGCVVAVRISGEALDVLVEHRLMEAAVGLTFAGLSLLGTSIFLSPHAEARDGLIRTTDLTKLEAKLEATERQTPVEERTH